MFQLKRPQIQSGVQMVMSTFLWIWILAGIAMPQIEPAKSDKNALDQTEGRTAKEVIDDKPIFADLTVHVTDEGGIPIVGAFVYPRALMVNEQDGHGFWTKERFGQPKIVMTDGKGIAVIQYPASFRGSDIRLTTRNVTISAHHPEYASQEIFFNLGPDIAQLALNRGAEIQFEGIDADRKPLQDIYVEFCRTQTTGYLVSASRWNYSITLSARRSLASNARQASTRWPPLVQPSP